MSTNFKWKMYLSHKQSYEYNAMCSEKLSTQMPSVRK